MSNIVTFPSPARGKRASIPDLQVARDQMAGVLARLGDIHAVVSALARQADDAALLQGVQVSELPGSAECSNASYRLNQSASPGGDA